MDSSSVVVVNPIFCAPHPIDLAFTTKPPGDKKSGHLAAVDAAGSVLFRTKGSSSVTRLKDAAGNTLLTMKPKFWTLHERWRAFAGDSTKKKDLVFSVKRSSFFQFKNVWHVFLAGNTEEESCDFKITGSFRKKTYTFYRGDSSIEIAKLSKEHKLNLAMEKGSFGATINPYCDHSFVSALIAIFHKMYLLQKKRIQKMHHRHIHGNPGIHGSHGSHGTSTCAISIDSTNYY